MTNSNWRLNLLVYASNLELWHFLSYYERTLTWKPAKNFLKLMILRFFFLCWQLFWNRLLSVVEILFLRLTLTSLNFLHIFL